MNSSYAGLEAENYSLNCPNCGEMLERQAFEGGKRLARCWHCGGMVRAAVRPRIERPGSLENSGSPVRPRLEVAPAYGLPNLVCPYCEHINRDQPGQADSLYCANCGAQLKTACLNCESLIYVLDHFCPYCRADQERARYELEVYYWQQFNEGKRLAQAGRWDEAHSYLALFFDPDAIGAEPLKARQAQELYRHSIAPVDNGEGLQLYNEALAHLRRQMDGQIKQEERRRLAKWGVVAVLFCLLGLWSALTFGAWWAIFVIGLVAVLIIGVLVLFVVLSIGIG